MAAPPKAVTPALPDQNSSVSVYQLYHFVRHAAHLNRKAQSLDSGLGNGDEIREAFCYTTGLISDEAASFLSVAISLDEQFTKLDSEAANIIQKAKSGLKPGDLIPPPPPELDKLQLQKENLISNLAFVLNSRIGASTNKLINTYLIRSTARQQAVKDGENGNATASSRIRWVAIAVACSMYVARPTNCQTIYKIVNASSGLVLDVSGSSTANGADIHQWQWNSPSDPNKQSVTNNTNQQWTIVPTANGYNKIVSVSDAKVVDVAGSSTANGVGVHQWDWVNGTNQQWKSVPQSSRFNSLINLNSQKALDVGYSMANGGPVYQWDYYGGPPQQWSIVPVQTSRWFTSATSIFYHANGNFPEVMSSVDQDYGSSFYYTEKIGNNGDR